MPTPQSFEDLAADTPAPGVVRLTLNRPQRRNALSRQLAEHVKSALGTAAADPDVRVAIIRGAGPSFCAGADLTEHFVSTDEPPDIGRTGLWEAIESLPIPVIAAVHGAVVTGGFLLAYSCDLVVASEDAFFRDTHAVLGLLPTGGETQRMPRRLGAALATELMLTSRPLGADEARAAGLVSRVVPRSELDGVALELAERIAANSPRSVATIKRLLLGGMRTDFAAGVRMEEIANDFGAANLLPDPEREARLARFRSGQPI